MRPFIPGRKKDSHKGDYGRALIIAGSRGMTGAAVLAARTALKAGAGLVIVACPGSGSVRRSVRAGWHNRGREDELWAGPGEVPDGRGRRDVGSAGADGYEPDHGDAETGSPGGGVRPGRI